MRPRDAILRSQLGAALRAAGRIDDAISAYRAALELAPDLAIAHNNLGNALREKGDLGGSAHHLEEAIKLSPDYPEAHFNLSLTMLWLDQLEEAERLCECAVELKANYPEALVGLSRLRGRRGDYRQALDAVQRSISLAPRRPEGHLEHATVLQAMGRFDEADGAIAKAADLAPNLPQVQFALGRNLEQRGDESGAAAAFRKALSGQPDLSGAYLSLAGLTSGGLSDEELAAAERVAGRRDLPRDERSSLCFALARGYERRKDFDRAFAWARQGNDIESSRTKYDEAETIDFVRRSVVTFPAVFFRRTSPASSSDRPIFIVGFPRSGTTLVEQIVASHPQAAAGGELVDIPDIVNELPNLTNLPYPDCLADFSDGAAEKLARRYLKRLDEIDPDATRVTDKLPFNFRNLGLIARLLPNARIIHCRRDPRDIAVSCYFIKFHRPISFAQSLFDFGAYWRQYRKLMRHWADVLPLPILEVDYEEIVEDPEKEIRRIIDFAGLPWDDRCLRFYESGSVVRTASVNQIRNPIYRASVGRWRRYARHLTPLFFELAKGGSPGASHKDRAAGVARAEAALEGLG